MLKSIAFSILVILLLPQVNCFAQEEKATDSWLVNFSAGISGVHIAPELNSDYQEGFSLTPEIICNFSDMFSASFTCAFIAANHGENTPGYDRVQSVELGKGAKVYNHYQVTLAPMLHFYPIKSRKHHPYLAFGPGYSFGNAVLSETFSEMSTTLAHNINDFGYVVEIGYRFNICKNWAIGAKYIYNETGDKTENLMFSVGYMIR